MIYAYDKAANIPLVDIYDKQMMLAEIAAAKDMYEKGLQEMKDFREKYGDLMFSNDAYQDWYNNEFNIGGFISDLYKQGIDPVRSAEGRSMVQQYINSRDYGNLAQRRAWDANMQAYKHSIATNPKLYDPGFEQWRIGGDINNWGDRPFTQSSIVPYENLQEMTLPSFNTISPHLLTTEEARERLGADYNPRNNYTGITRADMEDVMGQWMPGVRNSALFQYHRELAKQDLVREGNPNPSDDQIDARLVDNAITSNSGKMTPLEQKADEWELLQQKYNNDINLENLKYMHDVEVAGIKANKDNADGNYLHVLSNQAASTNGGFYLSLLANRQEDLERIERISDPEEQRREFNKLHSRLFNDFLSDPRYGYDGRTPVARMIMSMEDNVGNTESTHTINGILDNMATSGDSEMNAEYLLKTAGCVPDGDGEWKITKGGAKVVTPHELLGNIIKYSGNGNFNTDVPMWSNMPNGPKVTSDALVSKLERIAGGYEKQSWYDISDREPGNVAAGTEKVIPDSGEKNVIIAPDNNGKRYLWVKVTSVGKGMFEGDHAGYWMKTPVEIGIDNIPVTDSRSVIYGSGVRERHTYGNAGVSQEYENVR